MADDKTKEGTLKEIGPNGEVIAEYIKGDYVGKGGFATCYLIKNEKNKKDEKEVYLVKEIPYNEATDKEARLHSELVHKNIVKLHRYFINDNKTLYLILDYCENKDLSTLVKKRKRLTEIEVQYYIWNLIDALQYLHYEKRIVHCDLKPGNIFLTDKLEVKLGDFGLAKRITLDFTPINNGGTVYYMAPESFEIKKICSFSIDIWAVGIIMYNLLTGKVPFHGKDRKETENKINNDNCEFPQDIIISEIAKDLIIQILNKDPKKRPSLDQILKHQFFRMGRSIPKLLPKSFADKEPSFDYISNFLFDVDENGITTITKENTTLTDIIIENDKGRDNATTKKTNASNVYVKECYMNQNYINKYGLAYILSDNYCGVCFRDGTKIICNPGTNNCLYLKNGDIKKFNLNDEDYFKNIKDEKDKKDIDKKKKLLRYFMDSKSRNNSSNGIYESDENKTKTIDIDNTDISEDNQIYVKHYYIYDKEPIVLRFNNKNIQVIFNQNEIILLSKAKKEATFIKKDKSELKSNVFQFDNVMDTQNMEIIKKLQYTKSLLARIINEDIS